MMLKKINVFLNQKFKIQLLFIVIFGFTISLMELIGIGLIPFFVGILTQKEKFLDFIPITNFKDYLYSFNEFNLFLFFSFFIVLVFLIKNILIFLLNYLENKIYLNIVVFNSSRLMKYYINSSYQLHLERNSSKFLRNLSHDTEATADLINSLVKIFREILMGLLILALLLKTNPSITIFSVGVLSIITFAVYLLIKKKLKNLVNLLENF